MQDPISFLFTFTCYGTWLHGDDRTSVDNEHRVYGTPKAAPSAPREHQRQAKLEGPALKLDAAMRRVVDDAIREVCAYRGWVLHALNVRTNHVHVAAYGFGVKPEKMLADFKAYATRNLRRQGLIAKDAKVWTHHGSTRWVWTEESLARVIGYVRDAQGPDLPME